MAAQPPVDNATNCKAKTGAIRYIIKKSAAFRRAEFSRKAPIKQIKELPDKDQTNPRVNRPYMQTTQIAARPQIKLAKVSELAYQTSGMTLQ